MSLRKPTVASYGEYRLIHFISSTRHLRMRRTPRPISTLFNCSGSSWHGDSLMCQDAFSSFARNGVPVDGKARVFRHGNDILVAAALKSQHALRGLQVLVGSQPHSLQSHQQPGAFDGGVDATCWFGAVRSLTRHV